MKKQIVLAPEGEIITLPSPREAAEITVVAIGKNVVVECAEEQIGPRKKIINEKCDCGEIVLRGTWSA